MATLACPNCGHLRQLSADASERCAVCGALLRTNAPSPGPKIRVDLGPSESQPASVIAPLASFAPAKLSMRMRRLLADAEQMQRAFGDFPPIRIVSTLGTPPELYQIEYRVRGLARGPNGKPSAREQHRIEITLTSEYPRCSPKCKMLTPIFHPNIEPVAICVGDHWTAAERLVDLVGRIAEMIAFQAYNIKSPLDGEAAMWADQNRELLPIDPRCLRPPELE